MEFIEIFSKAVRIIFGPKAAALTPEKQNRKKKHFV